MVYHTHKLSGEAETSPTGRQGQNLALVGEWLITIDLLLAETIQVNTYRNPVRRIHFVGIGKQNKSQRVAGLRP